MNKCFFLQTINSEYLHGLYKNSKMTPFSYANTANIKRILVKYKVALTQDSIAEDCRKIQELILHLLEN